MENQNNQNHTEQNEDTVSEQNPSVQQDHSEEQDDQNMQNDSEEQAQEPTLQEKYEAALDQIEEQKTDFLRRIAEFENIKKRLQKEKEDFAKYSNEKFLSDIFPVLDSLEMTLSHVKDEEKDTPIVKGVDLILKQFLDVLKKQGLEEIDGTGEKFDPNTQEAVSTAPHPEGQSDIVIQTHRKGYKLKDRVLRAAMVTVSQ